MRHAASLVACMLVFTSCSTKLLRTEPVYDGRPLPTWQTLSVDHSYADSTCAVLRLSPRLQLHSVRAFTDVYKRSWFPGDDNLARTDCTKAGWLGGCLAGPLLYMATGYFDFFALAAIGPVVTVLARTRLLFPKETRRDTVVGSTAEVPERVSITAVGNTQRTREVEVSDGVADLYLSDFYELAPPDSDIVLSVSARGARDDVAIPVHRADLSRACRIEAKALGLWLSMRKLEESGEYSRAFRLCQDLLHDYGSTALVGRDSAVAERAMKLRLSVLDRTSDKGVACLIRAGLSAREIDFTAARLSTMDDGVRYTAVTQGLGLKLEGTKAILYYSGLTWFQRLYAVLALSEILTSHAESAQQWFAKRLFLKDWLDLTDLDIAEKLAHIDSAQLLDLK